MKLKFRELLSEFLSSNFNFDTKLGRTMLDLLLSPGEITKQFNSGKRVRYVRPLQLYLFVSFLYFLLLGVTTETVVNRPPTNVAEAEKAVNESVIDLKMNGEDLSSVSEMLNNTDPNNDAQIDTLLKNFGTPEPEDWERHIAKQAVRALNPEYEEQLKQEIFANLSWSMFILLPVFAIYLWLLVRKQAPFYIDSIIFSVHFHTVVFILFGIRLLSEFVYAGEAIEVLTTFLALLYLVLSIKNVYGLRWRWAILKSILLTVGYTMTFGVAYITVLVFSFWRF